MPTIRQINEECVRFISAGEKINDIETVVRELVENSIDAKATNIEIRLGKFGIDYIEVDDNGIGIDECDFQYLGQRYHTSKISDYEKLQKSLETFGFRGEALSCLCAISNVSISTKSASSPTGTKLTFNNDGGIQKLEPVARANGTTVTVKNLFHSLPVRRRELDTCAKRQYHKVVRIVYEHVLTKPHIKFTLCKNTKMKKEKDFTYGGTTLEKCIVSIFGMKTFDSLMPIKQPDDRKSQRRMTKSKFVREKATYSIHGYISKLGLGRNSTDCQFIFVNDKPCEVPKILRLINDTFRAYSRNQTPFLCIFVQVENWAADFNVPRKRSVILSEENRLCDIVKNTLDAIYSSENPTQLKSCETVQIPFMTIKEPAINSDPILEQPKQILKKSRNSINDSSERDKDILMELSENGFKPATEYYKYQLLKENRASETDLAATMQHANDSSDSDDDISMESPVNPPKLAIDYYKCQWSQENSTREGKLTATLEHIDDMASALERERFQRQLVVDSKQYSFAIDPSLSRPAEQELKLNLCRESFENMEVLGQFNNGFIITRYNDHIFIIDQHATDERANFEDELEKCPMEQQYMVRPKPLLMNSIQENAIMTNIEEFERRGFRFVIDGHKIPGYRVQLVSTSICKGQGMDVYLDEKDIEELVSIATDSPRLLPNYTLRKVKELAASRACRKSVMIGDKLTRAQMIIIVSKMSRLSNPWICAHDRPTIRHLMDVEWMYRSTRFKRP